MIDLRPAFLADIVEHPDDDAPRLIFADWLEDNGEPEWSEFIRLQLRIAKPWDYNDPARVTRWEYDDLCNKGRKMLRAEKDGVPLWHRWCDLLGVPHFGDVPEDQPHLAYGFNRGVMALVQGPWLLWKKWGPLLVRVQPIEQYHTADLNRVPQYARKRVARNPGQGEGPWLSAACIEWAKQQIKG